MPQFIVNFEALYFNLRVCLEYKSPFTSPYSLSLLQTVYHRKALFIKLIIML